jgi:hypothetical protein
MGDLESRRPSKRGRPLHFWPRRTDPFICGSEQSLAAAVVSRGTTCVPQKKTRRAGHDAAGKLGVSVKKRGEPTTDSLVRLKRPPLSRIVEVPLVRQSHGASSLV